MTQTESPPLHPLLRIEKSFSNPDVGYWDGRNRERTDDDHEDWLIDGLLPIGASVLSADPGGNLRRAHAWQWPSCQGRFWPGRELAIRTRVASRRR